MLSKSLKSAFSQAKTSQWKLQGTKPEPEQLNSAPRTPEDLQGTSPHVEDFIFHAPQTHPARECNALCGPGPGLEYPKACELCFCKLCRADLRRLAWQTPRSVNLNGAFERLSNAAPKGVSLPRRHVSLTNSSRARSSFDGKAGPVWTAMAGSQCCERRAWSGFEKGSVGQMLSTGVALCCRKTCTLLDLACGYWLKLSGRTSADLNQSATRTGRADDAARMPSKASHDGNVLEHTMKRPVEFQSPGPKISLISVLVLLEECTAFRACETPRCSPTIATLNDF